MEKITEKEWVCLNAYVVDLLNEMRENKDDKICDKYNEYTIKELETLQEKLLQELITCSSLYFFLEKKISK